MSGIFQDTLNPFDQIDYSFVGNSDGTILNTPEITEITDPATGDEVAALALTQAANVYGYSEVTVEATNWTATRSTPPSW